MIAFRSCVPMPDRKQRKPVPSEKTAIPGSKAKLAQARSVIWPARAYASRMKNQTADKALRQKSLPHVRSQPIVYAILRLCAQIFKQVAAGDIFPDQRAI